MWKLWTRGISTNMEVYGLKKILERICGQIMVAEIVTDASAAVIALAQKMKGNLSICHMQILYKKDEHDVGLECNIISGLRMNLNFFSFTQLNPGKLIHQSTGTILL